MIARPIGKLPVKPNSVKTILMLIEKRFLVIRYVATLRIFL